MAVHTPEQIAADRRVYMKTFLWLGILTAAEIAVTYLPQSKVLIGFLLVGLASWKASMVALRYMHLSHEKRTLLLIALTPAILCAFLVFMLMPDLTHSTRIRSKMTPDAAAPATH